MDIPFKPWRDGELQAITLEDSVLAEAFEQAYKNTHSTKGAVSGVCFRFCFACKIM
jgi:hypothetical protein